MEAWSLNISVDNNQLWRLFCVLNMSFLPKRSQIKYVTICLYRGFQVEKCSFRDLRNECELRQKWWAPCRKPLAVVMKWSQSPARAPGGVQKGNWKTSEFGQRSKPHQPPRRFWYLSPNLFWVWLDMNLSWLLANYDTCFPSVVWNTAGNHPVHNFSRQTRCRVPVTWFAAQQKRLDHGVTMLFVHWLKRRGLMIVTDFGVIALASGHLRRNSMTTRKGAQMRWSTIRSFRVAKMSRSDNRVRRGFESCQWSGGFRSYRHMDRVCSFWDWILLAFSWLHREISWFITWYKMDIFFGCGLTKKSEAFAKCLTHGSRQFAVEPWAQEMSQRGKLGRWRSV